MRSKPSLILCLLLAGSLSVVQGCAAPAKTYQVFPSALDLTVEPKPVPSPEIVTSEAAADAYDASLEAWGERGWAAVARICRWAVQNGARFNCPPPAGAP